MSDAYGNFETDDYIISAQVQGIVNDFKIREGITLGKGQVVGNIDSTQLFLKVKQLEAQKRTVASRINNLDAEVQVLLEQRAVLLKEKQRIENMLKEDAVPQKQLDDVNGQLDVIQGRINATKTQKANIYNELDGLTSRVLQIRDQLSKCTIINPAEGKVLEVYIKENELAMPGKPLYKMANLNKMYLRAYVSGALLPHVKLGQDAEVIFDLNNEENQVLPGEVVWIAEEAEFTPKIIQTKEERVNLVYAVKILVNNDGRLKIGMPGEVNFK